MEMLPFAHDESPADFSAYASTEFGQNFRRPRRPKPTSDRSLVTRRPPTDRRRHSGALIVADVDLLISSVQVAQLRCHGVQSRWRLPIPGTSPRRVERGLPRPSRPHRQVRYPQQLRNDSAIIADRTSAKSSAPPSARPAPDTSAAWSNARQFRVRPSGRRRRR